MIYGFNENKEKVEIVVVQETVTIPQGVPDSPWTHADINPQKLKTDYGMDDLTKYVLVGWCYGTPNKYTIPHHFEETNTDPYIEFDTRPTGNGIIVWGYQPSGSYSYNIKVVFIKVA